MVNECREVGTRRVCIALLRAPSRHFLGASVLLAEMWLRLGRAAAASLLKIGDILCRPVAKRSYKSE